MMNGGGRGGRWPGARTVVGAWGRGTPVQVGGGGRPEAVAAADAGSLGEEESTGVGRRDKRGEHWHRKEG